MLQRTAKSCGPDAPTLASSLRSGVGPTGLRQNLIRRRRWQRARSPGRARHKPLKPLRAGMPGDSGVLVVARVRSTTTKCTRGRGCSGHPAFPTPSMGREINAQLGRIARRGRRGASYAYECVKFSAVVARESGRSSIPETPIMEARSHGVLVTPLSRSMTVLARSDVTLNSDAVIPGWSEGPDPESRDSGFALSRAPE